MAPDLFIHQGLREARLVAFVMAKAAIAEHIDHDRLVEALAEFGRDLRRMHDRFRVVAVHMEDRRLHHLRNVRRIGRRARADGARRKADLVVAAEVARTAGTVPLQSRKPKTYSHPTLTGKSPAAVDEERHSR